MFAFIHLLVGAAIGQFVGGWPLAFSLSFASHFFLDALPHTDAATFKKPVERGMLKLRDLVMIFFDLTAAFFIIYWWWQRGELSLPVAAGAVGGMAPDFGHPLFYFLPVLRTHPLTAWFFNFHKKIQGTVMRDRALFGAVVELVVAAAALYLFYR